MARRVSASHPQDEPASLLRRLFLVLTLPLTDSMWLQKVSVRSNLTPKYVGALSVDIFLPHKVSFRDLSANLFDRW